MWLRINKILLLTGFYLCATNTWAQTTQSLPDSTLMFNNITVVYDIKANSNDYNTSIAETYNGGIKTVMVKGGKARFRLVTLMRIQSVFFIKQDSNLAKVIILKESGNKRYKYQLSSAEWKTYNAKYDSATYNFINDSITVAGYNCKKVIISIPGDDVKEVTAYYSTSLKPLDKDIEPMFAGLPGMVLKYEHEAQEGSIIFTANQISFDQIDEKSFEAPTKGYTQKNYVSHSGQ